MTTLTDKEREARWEDGFHKNHDDKELPLKLIGYEHLENIIKLFKHLNTKAVRRELRRREVWVIDKAIAVLERHEGLSKTPGQRRRAKRAVKIGKLLSKYYD